MGKLLSNIHAVTLATGLALTGIGYAAAAPGFVPASPVVRSDVVPIVDSKIVRRDKAHHDGRDWKKRRHHREFREAKRDRWREKAHDHDGRAKLYRPRATPKYAYDAYGNYRVYDRGRRDGDWDRWDRWDGDRRDWDRRDWDRRDWDDNKRRKRPRIYRMNSLGHQEPSPGLRGVLTAVPD